ncbi:MAG: helix-hairpin-helix domain-containing protein [Ferruginibacter sp.]
MQKRQYGFFYFTKKERNGTLFLLLILFLVLLFPRIASFFQTEKIFSASEYSDEISNLKKLKKDSVKKYDSYKKYTNHYSKDHYEEKLTLAGSLFFFDPNTTSAADWKKLGVRDNTIATIQNYILKGGKFREPGDIKKIWGLQEKLAEKLIPYVKIKAIINTYKPEAEFEKKLFAKKEFTPVEINEADTAMLIALPGIGSKLSQRIINYRNKLGGFYSTEQVGETFGLPDSTYKKIRHFIKIDNVKIHQININTATLEELKVHPYIRYHLANVMVEYRNQHGKYSSIKEIMHIMLINDSIYRKISPYLTVE